MAFKWTSPRTWLAGEKPTAATLNAHIRDNLEALNGFKFKTADESVTNSAVLQADDHLTFVIPQAGTYLVDVWLITDSPAGGGFDFKAGFSFPGSSTMHFMGDGPSGLGVGGTTGSSQLQVIQSAVSGTSAIAFDVGTAVTRVHLVGILVAGAAGSVTLMWAQNGAGAQATNVRAGSFMTVKQVA